MLNLNCIQKGGIGMLEKTFGKKIDTKKYLNRIGAYAIIIDEYDRVVTVKTKKGNFLIGGGLDDLESHESCIIRESLEETGFSVKVKELICKTDTYCYIDSSNTYFHPISYFYLTEIQSKVQKPIENDHKFEWINKSDIDAKMYLEHQVWAIKQAISF